MLNRLAEIAERARANQLLRADSCIAEEENIREMEPLVGSSDYAATQMQRFLRIAGTAQNKISAVSKEVDALRGAVGRVVIVTSPAEERRLRKDVEQLSEAVLIGLKSSKSAILEVEEFLQSESEEDLESHYRMQVNMYRALLKQLDGQSKRFLQTESDFVTFSRDRGVRQLMLSTSVDRTEAEKLFDSGVTPDIATSQVFASADDIDLLNRLRSVSEDLRAVQSLERSMIEVRQLMQELAVLVNSQGEVVDSIEWDLVNTKNFSREAAKALFVASRRQDRKLKGWLVMLLVFIGIIFIVGFVWKLNLGDVIVGIMTFFDSLNSAVSGVFNGATDAKDIAVKGPQRK